MSTIKQKKIIILSAITIFFIILFLNLSYWQYTRSQEKQEILDKLNNPNIIINLNNHSDLINVDKLPSYQKISLTGYFDNNHSIYLDNQFYNHQTGYHILTPFVIKQPIKTVILVNRGWVKNIENKYNNNQYSKHQTITGYIKQPNTKQFILGSNIIKLDKKTENNTIYKIQRIDTQEINKSKLLPYNLINNYLLLINNNFKNLDNYPVTHWNIVNISPEKHLAYAVQWLLLAISLVILYLYFIYDKNFR